MEVGIDRNFIPVCLTDLMDDGKAESRAFSFLVASALSLIKSIKDLLSVFILNFASAVFDSEMIFPTFFLQRDIDSLLFSIDIFHRIVDEKVEHSGEVLFVRTL